MAKSPFPMQTGSGVLAKVVGTLVVVAVLTLVIKHPTNAAAAVTGLFHLATQAVDGISSFVQQLAG